MSDVGLELIGFAGFQARLEEALGGIEVLAMDKLEVTADNVAVDARTLAPVGTGENDVPGELAGSITVERIGKDMLITVGAPYAIHVEYGTSKMAAEPFLRPALAQASI